MHNAIDVAIKAVLDQLKYSRSEMRNQPAGKKCLSQEDGFVQIAKINPSLFREVATGNRKYKKS